MKEEILIFLLVVICSAFVYYLYCDMRYFKCIVAKSFEKIANKRTYGDLSYTDRNRLNRTCVDCKFLKVCKQDTESEGHRFDYLVCQDFEE